MGGLCLNGDWGGFLGLKRFRNPQNPFNPVKSPFRQNPRSDKRLSLQSTNNLYVQQKDQDQRAVGQR